jgi:elongation factor G
LSLRLRKDLDKLSNGLPNWLKKILHSQVKTDEQTGQTIISGMGELHLDIILDRLKREFKVECNQGKPQVNYKEAITQTVNLREVYKKQTGGRGKFADIIVNVGPVMQILRKADCSLSTRLRVVTFLRSSFLLYRKVSRAP